MTSTFFEYLGWVSLSPNLKESFNKTLADAEKHRHATVEIEHLLYALIDDPEGAIALIAMGVDRDELRDELADHLHQIPTGARVELARLQPARELKKLMAKASDMADNEHDDHIDGGDVVRALGEFDRLGDFDFRHHFAKQPEIKSPAPQNTRPRSHKKTAQYAPVQPPKTQIAPPAPAPEPVQVATAPVQTAPIPPLPPLPPQAGDETVEKISPTPKASALNFDVDPIKASIKAIMARRADAEEILYECEWYHLFKSLNMIDEGLEGEAQTYRAKLLAKAEMELAERPRCRKAFLYVRHLDQELDRLKGIVDIDWAGDITPDETVRQLSYLRAMPKDEKKSRRAPNLPSHNTAHSRFGDHLFDVKLQESEVLALEQKLARLDRTAGFSQDRLLELEEHLQSHDTHSKKRENIIGELESYLRSEMQLSDARDLRIIELEKELVSTKNITDSQVGKTSHLENELAAFKEHAGNRELLISELETSLRKEKNNATSHAEQVRELRTMLANEKERAETHDLQVAELQKTYEEEKNRATEHEQQVHTLEEDLKARLQQLKIREDQIRSLEDSLSTREKIKERQIKELEERLQAREQEKERQVTELQKNLNATEIHAAEQEKQLQTLHADLSSHTSLREEKERQIMELQKSLDAKETHTAEQEKQLQTLHTDLSAHASAREEKERQIMELQKSLESKETHVAEQEKQLQALLSDLSSHASAREEKERQVMELQKNLDAREAHLAEQEKQLQTLHTDLSSHTDAKDQHQYEINSLHVNHKQEVNKLLTNIQDHEGKGQLHQQEINALRAQLASLEGKLQDQETSYSVEKNKLSNTIDQLRQEIEESESLIEIIHATGEPYRVRSDRDNSDENQGQIITRRTIPIPAKPH